MQGDLRMANYKHCPNIVIINIITIIITIIIISTIIHTIDYGYKQKGLTFTFISKRRSQHKQDWLSKKTKNIRIHIYRYILRT